VIATNFIQDTPILNAYSSSYTGINTLCNRRQQSTLGHTIRLTGNGVHSGDVAHVTLHSATANTGIIFVRSDIKGESAFIPATYTAVCDTRMCTKLSNASGVTVSTVEHLLAALSGAGITNALIEVDGPEIPILDGSSLVFSEAITRASVFRQDAFIPALRITQPVRVDQGQSFVEFIPSEQSLFDVCFDFYGRLQSESFIRCASFNRDADDF
jgi:UDP-3-O-[3-hydroxymyristoyl] N-acetylglucosamine deacetylase